MCYYKNLQDFLLALDSVAISLSVSQLGLASLGTLLNHFELKDCSSWKVFVKL